MGFWSDEVEIAGLESLELLEGNRVNPPSGDAYSIADEEAIKHVIVNNKNDMDAYRTLYMTWFRKKYRETFSASILAAQGFLPETASFNVLDNAAYLSWIQSSTSPTATTFLGVTTGPLRPWTQARLYTQDTWSGDWDNETRILYNAEIDGVTGDWDMVDVIDEPDFGRVKIDMLSRDGHGNKYIYGAYYSIAPPTSASLLRYESSSFPGQWFLHDSLASDVPESVWSTMYEPLSPIIAIKEDNVMNSEETKVKNILDDLGIDGTDLWDKLILTCPDTYVPPEDDPYADCDDSIKVPSEIDNAYVLTGIDPETDDDGVYAGLYAWFDTFALMSGEGTFKLAMSALSINYDFNISKTSHTGVIGSKNTYTKTITNTLNGDGYATETLTMQFQDTESTYKKIVVTEFNQSWLIISEGTGWSFYSTLSFDPEETDEGTKVRARLVLPLSVYEGLDYEDWLGVHETGMCLLAYAKETQKLKWYETGIFKIILLIAITVVTWGQGTFAASAILDAILKAVVSFMIGQFASVIAGMVDSEFLQMLVFVVAAVATIYALGGNLDIDKMTGFDGFYKMADTTLNAYNKVENLQMQTQMAEMSIEIQERQEEIDKKEEEIKEMKGINAAIYVQDYSMDIASVTPGGMESPEEYFHSRTGGQMFDFDYLFDIDEVYNIKKNVKT